MMYSEMTLQQRLGLTDEGMAELKAATHDELSELGFSDFLKAKADKTYDAIAEQIDNDCDLAVRVLEELHNWHAPHGVCKDNYESVLEWWIDEKADYLHA